VLDRLVSLPSSEAAANAIPVHSLKTKTISNELGRICRMHFLNRRKMVRSIVSADGRTFNRGYKYLYRISAQWKSYNNWRKQGGKRKSRYPGDLQSIIEVEMARQVLAEPFKPYAYEIDQIFFNKGEHRSVYKRFPVQNTPELIILLGILHEKIGVLQEITESLKREICKVKEERPFDKGTVKKLVEGVKKDMEYIDKACDLIDSIRLENSKLKEENSRLKGG
jgi:hypothetical protein